MIISEGGTPQVGGEAYLADAIHENGLFPRNAFRRYDNALDQRRIFYKDRQRLKLVLCEMPDVGQAPAVATGYEAWPQVGRSKRASVLCIFKHHHHEEWFKRGFTFEEDDDDLLESMDEYSSDDW